MTKEVYPKSNPKKQKIKNLVWIDLEMTGLNPVKDKILEISAIITNKNLNIIAEQPGIVIHESDKVINNINSLVKGMHQQSGLIDEIRKSKITLKQAQDTVYKFINKYVKKYESPLCGSSVQTDKYFLLYHMPKIFSYLYHRIIDVSTLKQLYAMWNPKGKPFFEPKKDRALDDIKRSIHELKYYREVFLKCSNSK
jgi:oligoribonuclease